MLAGLVLALWLIAFSPPERRRKAPLRWGGPW
jgi:hypothetical protein